MIVFVCMQFEMLCDMGHLVVNFLKEQLRVHAIAALVPTIKITWKLGMLVRLTVDSKKLDTGPGTIYGGFTSFFGFWVGGQSYSNFLASILYWVHTGGYGILTGLAKSTDYYYHKVWLCAIPSNFGIHESLCMLSWRLVASRCVHDFRAVDLRCSRSSQAYITRIECLGTMCKGLVAESLARCVVLVSKS